VTRLVTLLPPGAGVMGVTRAGDMGVTSVYRLIRVRSLRLSLSRTHLGRRDIDEKPELHRLAQSALNCAITDAKVARHGRDRRADAAAVPIGIAEELQDHGLGAWLQI